jgi:adenosine deaminase
LTDPTLPSAEWVRRLPKAEVHLHLEGCVPFEMIDDGSRPAFAGGALSDLLAYLDWSCGRVTERGQLEEIAYRLVERAAGSGVRHVDVIANPTHWPHFAGRIEEMIGALDAGMAAGEAEHDITGVLCLSVKRDQSAVEALALADMLAGLDHRRARALSIDGDEADGKASRNERFAPAFRRAAEAGLRRCAHAGESSGPQGVIEAIELLGAERVDHGVRLVEDPAAMATVVERAVPLDVCPSSNVLLGLVPDLEAHPLRRLVEAGVRCSVNTDDPLVYGIDLVGEYLAVAGAFSWRRGELARLARVSIESCFAAPERLAALLEELDRYVAA